MPSKFKPRKKQLSQHTPQQNLVAISEPPYPEDLLGTINSICANLEKHASIIHATPSDTQKLRGEFDRLVQDIVTNAPELNKFNHNLERIVNDCKKSNRSLDEDLKIAIFTIGIVALGFTTTEYLSTSIYLMVLTWLVLILLVLKGLYDQYESRLKTQNPTETINKSLVQIFSDIPLWNKKGNEKTSIEWENCSFNYTYFDRESVSILIHILKLSNFICFKGKKSLVVYCHKQVTREESEILDARLKQTFATYDILCKFVDKLNERLKDNYGILTNLDIIPTETGFSFFLYFQRYYQGEETQASDLKKILDALFSVTTPLDCTNLPSAEELNELMQNPAFLSDKSLLRILGEPDNHTLNATAADSDACSANPPRVSTPVPLKDTLPSESTAVITAPPVTETQNPAISAAPPASAPILPQRRSPDTLFQAQAPQDLPNVKLPRVVWQKPDSSEEPIAYYDKNEPDRLALFAYDSTSKNGKTTDTYYYAYFPETTKTMDQELRKKFEKSFNAGLSNGTGKRIGQGIVEEYRSFVIKIHGAPRVYSKQQWITTGTDNNTHILVVFDTYDKNFHDQESLNALKKSGPAKHKCPMIKPIDYVNFREAAYDRSTELMYA